MDCSLLASLSMDFPGKNIGVGCHFLLQGIFPTQGSNPRISCIAGGFFTTEPQGKPSKSHTTGQMAEPQKVWSIFAFLNSCRISLTPSSPLQHVMLIFLQSISLSHYFLNPLTTTDILRTDSFLGEYRSPSRTYRKSSRGTNTLLEEWWLVPAPERKSKWWTQFSHHDLYMVAKSEAGGQSPGFFQRMKIVRLRLKLLGSVVSTPSLAILWHARFNEGLLNKRRMLLRRSWTHHKSWDIEEWLWGWVTVKSTGALQLQVWSLDQ